MWQSRHKWHCVTNFSVTSGWYTLYHAVFAVTFDIIYSLSCLWRINFIQVMGQKYKNCYFRLKCYFCKCAEIKSWHIYVWSQHLCKRLDSSCDVLRPKTNIPTPFTPRITMFCRFLWTQTYGSGRQRTRTVRYRQIYRITCQKIRKSWHTPTWHSPTGSPGAVPPEVLAQSTRRPIRNAEIVESLLIIRIHTWISDYKPVLKTWAERD